MDKFILITGGTKGIGKAVASCLGKAGYNLILTYASDQAAAEEVRSELVGRFDIQVSILRADISDRNTIGVIDSFLEENRLRLDGLVFNAGMTCRDPLRNFHSRIGNGFSLLISISRSSFYRRLLDGLIRGEVSCLRVP